MNNIPISKRIRKIYILGATVLLFFYTIVFNTALLFTEDSTNLERLKVVAPYLFQHYQQGESGVIKIDPLVTLYDSFDSLPNRVKPRINAQWIGEYNLFFEDDTELNMLAQVINTPSGNRIVYAIEQIDLIEVNDINLAVTESIIFLSGLVILLIIARFILNTIQEVTQPFTSLAQALENDVTFNSLTPKITGQATFESTLTLDAVNQYRSRIHKAMVREQSFTRYVSHELRTPMTVIQGCVSLLRKSDDSATAKQCDRIAKALKDMETLTRTFLMLARNKDIEHCDVTINDAFIDETLAPLQFIATANNVELERQVLAEFELQAEPLLVSVLLQNIVTNAINSSDEGNVSVFIAPDKLEVVDNGVGLNSKPRGYEGFGIGLQIVEDICLRYDWIFQIKNNASKGCTATVYLSNKMH